ncbi:Scr1 family TA system antitoxin-like transcriptional regulator [Streptomyces sp. NPDC059373]
MGDGVPQSWGTFGLMLGHYRGLKGLTQAELGQRMGYSESQVASVEQGRRLALPDFVAKAEEVLGARDALFKLAKTISADGLPAFFANFAAIEAEAVTLYSYENHAIPGLLQTEAYARAVIGAYCPPLDDDEIERRVQARVGRQAALTRKPPLIAGFVLDEVALRHPIGGRMVQKNQLLRLLECGSMRNVQIQVMPTEVEEHPGMDGPFVLVEGVDRRDLAYIEVQEVSVLLADPTEVSVLKARYGIIRAQALTPRDSADLIRKLAEEL